MKTKTISVVFAGAMFLVLTGSVPARAGEVSVNIGIGVPPPPVVIHEPPPVVIYEPPPVAVIPGTYVYFAPDIVVDIFFFHGHWYRPHDGRWYRAVGYDGPWHRIGKHRVPRVVRELPPDYRRQVRYHERIRYQDLNKNWQAWERDRRWDRRDYKKNSQAWDPYRDWDRNKHEVQNARDDRQWEKTARQDNRKEKKNGRGGKGKNKR